jgi:hypothetical protein
MLLCLERGRPVSLPVLLCHKSPPSKLSAPAALVCSAHCRRDTLGDGGSDGMRDEVREWVNEGMVARSSLICEMIDDERIVE